MLTVEAVDHSSDHPQFSELSRDSLSLLVHSSV